MSQPSPPPDPVKITDHYGKLHTIDLAICTRHGLAQKPNYLEQTPSRIGSDWIVRRFTEGHSLELWQTGDGIWLVVDRTDLTGVVINGDQLRDLRVVPAENRAPP